MKQNKSYAKNIYYILSIFLIAHIIIGCNSGNSTSTNLNVADNSVNQLANYKSLLSYTLAKEDLKISALLAGFTKQQAFVVPSGGITLNSVRVMIFSSSSCDVANVIGVVTLNGGSNGVMFPPGTYTSSNASNLALYGKFGMDPLMAKSVRFDYYYNSRNGGPGYVAASCMNDTGIADYDGDSPTGCLSGLSCGFNQAIMQVAFLPASFVPAIFLTKNSYTGNLGGFSGADAKCMADPALPVRGAGSQWKALLNNNRSTQSGVAYYRDDYATIISTANGYDLNGWGDTSGLIGSIFASDQQVWTGFTPSMDTNYSGWITDIAGADRNSCANWTSDSGILIASGVYGKASSTNAQSHTNSPGFNDGWAVDEMAGCDNKLFLYCVQQNN
jgi:hypothetical protein